MTGLGTESLRSLANVARVAGVALATAFLAGSLSFSQIAFDRTSRPARWFLADWSLGAPSAAPGKLRFGPNALLSLPLVTSGGDLRVSLRLVAGVRGDIDLVACGRALGSARAPAGEPARLIIEGGPVGPCALDLRLVLRPDPFYRTGAIDASYELERVGVRSAQGLHLAPAYAALIGWLPAAVALAIGIAGIGPGRPLRTALVVAPLALAWAAWDPVSAAAGVPWVAAISLLAGAGFRVRPSAERLARRVLVQADKLSDVTPAPRAPWFALAGLALVPAVVTWVSLQLLVGRGLSDHVPALNDATNYWLESAAFGGLAGPAVTSPWRSSRRSFPSRGSACMARDSRWPTVCSGNSSAGTPGRPRCSTWR